MESEQIKKDWPGIVGQLQAGDILLFHKRKGWISRAIQKRTKSYWSHTGLVFMPKQYLPVGGPLIVEASYIGIEIHQMKRYSDRFDEYDIGVMRVPGLTEEQKNELVMGFILNNIDVSYDYSRLMGLFLRPILKKISSKLFLKFAKWVTHEELFVCSTFVYKAFRDMSTHQKDGARAQVEDQARSRLKKEETITPGDIAKEPAFDWIYNQQE